MLVSNLTLSYGCAKDCIIMKKEEILFQFAIHFSAVHPHWTFMRAWEVARQKFLEMAERYQPSLFQSDTPPEDWRIFLVTLANLQGVNVGDYKRAYSLAKVRYHTEILIQFPELRGQGKMEVRVGGAGRGSNRSNSVTDCHTKSPTVA